MSETLPPLKRISTWKETTWILQSIMKLFSMLFSGGKKKFFEGGFLQI